mmetsp:Transcript_24466/g.44121  ORF Transcript_24466/g.44121 Transcript_24466/m.44121 type:complete len:204 (+) Transcript_24466:2374-2985(+)
MTRAFHRRGIVSPSRRRGSSSVRRIDQLSQLWFVLFQLSQRNNIDENVILLQLLPRLDQRTLIRALKRRSNEQHDALRSILVTTMLQRQRGHLHGRGNVHGILPCHVHLSTKRDSMQCRQYFSQIVRRTDQKFGTRGRTRGGHGDDAYGRFGIALGFLIDDHVGRVALGLHASGDVIAIAHEFGVIQEDHARFERHDCCCLFD